MNLKDHFDLELVGSPPQGWSTGHMKIHARRPADEDGPVITEAWLKGAFAIHLTKDGVARLSHAPTGMGIWTFETPELAADCADDIAPFADWAAIKRRLKSGGELYPKVRAVIDRIEASAPSPSVRADVENTGGSQ